MIKEFSSPRFSNKVSISLKELRLLPNLTEKNLKTSLETSIAKGITLKVPFMSAAMQSVTGPEMAVALAQQGGIGIIFTSQTIKSQAEMIKKVKNHKVGFLEKPLTISPETSLEELFKLYKETKYGTYPVTDDGTHTGKYLGIVFSEDFFLEEGNKTAKQLMRKDVPVHKGSFNLKDAINELRKLKQKCLPVIEGEKLKGIIFRKDIIEEKVIYPNQLLDENKRLIVGGAINTHDYEKRIPALIEAGVDLLVIDSSDGFTEYQADVIKFIKENHASIPVVAGNVVTKEGFNYLIKQGADAVKIGMGGGSICITQEVKGVGRGQATALIECAEERDKHYEKTGNYVPLISDGGISTDRDIITSLALGADAVMMGRYFARFKESPTAIIEMEGNKFKPYWGEGSQKAKNWQRYNNSDSTFIEEGVEGYVPYAGMLDIEKTALLIKLTMKNIGAGTIRKLHEKAVFEYISEGSRTEGKPHDLIRIKKA